MKVTLVIITLLFLLGCKDKTSQSQSSVHNDLGGEWKNATIQERKELIDVAELYKQFKNQKKENVIKIFGKPDFEGENSFAQYELRYNFDPIPDTKLFQHLSFIIEEKRIVRIEANILPPNP